MDNCDVNINKPPDDPNAEGQQSGPSQDTMSIVNRDSGHKPEKRSYKFKPLLYEDSIRLLVIEPGESPSAIQARLVEHRLSQNPAYEAVSYTWGGSEFPDSIIIDGLHFSVTENLYLALSKFRDSKDFRYLWVDAVCIDQQKQEEKAAQVSMMNRIYTLARNVLVWLGPGTEKSDQAMVGLTGYLKEMENEGIEVPSPFGYELIEQPFKAPPATVRKVIHATELVNLDSLYTRAWFSCLWVVQEAVLAKSVTFHCGSHSLDWTIIASAILLYRTAVLTLHLNPKHGKDFHRACMVVIAKRAYWFSTCSNIISTKPWSEFGHILSMLSSQDCTNDHDRVYALLGLRPPNGITGIHRGIIPDYTIPLTQLYQEFTRPYLNPDGISLLNRVGIHNHLRPVVPRSISECMGINYLPSWSLDLRRQPKHIRVPWREDYFKADRYIPRIWFPQPPIPSPTPVLLVGARLWDTVEEVLLHPCWGDPEITGIRDSVLFLKQKITDADLPINQPVELVLASLITADGSHRIWAEYFGHDGPDPDAMIQRYKEFESMCLTEGTEFWRMYTTLRSQHRDIDVGVFLANVLSPAILALSPDLHFSIHYYLCVYEVLNTTTPFRTSENYFGLAPRVRGTRLVVPNMWVALVAGGRTPYLIAPFFRLFGWSTFVLVGSCFVHGIMWGQVRQFERIKGIEGTWGVIAIV